MEFGHNIISGLKQRIFQPNQSAELLAPEWHGLQARFAAAHAVRREFLRLDAQRPRRSGDFTHWMTDCSDQSFPNVNPNNLADGKDSGGITISTTGAAHAGDRGKQ